MLGLRTVEGVVPLLWIQLVQLVCIDVGRRRPRGTADTAANLNLNTVLRLKGLVEGRRIGDCRVSRVFRVSPAAAVEPVVVSVLENILSRRLDCAVRRDRIGVDGGVADDLRVVSVSGSGRDAVHLNAILRKMFMEKSLDNFGGHFAVRSQPVLKKTR